LFIVNKQFEGRSNLVFRGVLSDVAPTILGLMGINKPQVMTGIDLLKNLGIENVNQMKPNLKKQIGKQQFQDS
ncbi:hypothetical protein KA005_66845, partial [bacterium]|nr:hypothetical protein [bacterium]